MGVWHGTTALVLGMLVGSLIVISAEPAFAVCDDRRTENSAQTSANRGIKVQQMEVANTAVGCVRVSSVIVWSSTDDYAEIGWYEDPTGVITNCDATSGSPTLLVYGLYNGNPKCKKAPGTVSVGTHSFNTNDSDGDNNWEYYLDGTYKGVFNLRFIAGEPVTNAERRDGTDSMYADHAGLQKYNGGWVNWGSGTADWSRPHPRDPSYEVCIHTNTHTSVQLTCP